MAVLEHLSNARKAGQFELSAMLGDIRDWRQLYRVEIFEDNGRYRWQLVSATGFVAVQSETTYASIYIAQEALRSTLSCLSVAPVVDKNSSQFLDGTKISPASSDWRQTYRVEIYEDNGRYRWQLISATGFVDVRSVATYPSAWIAREALRSTVSCLNAAPVARADSRHRALV